MLFKSVLFLAAKQFPRNIFPELFHPLFQIQTSYTEFSVLKLQVQRNTSLLCLVYNFRPRKSMLEMSEVMQLLESSIVVIVHHNDGWCSNTVNPLDSSIDWRNTLLYNLWHQYFIMRLKGEASCTMLLSLFQLSQLFFSTFHQRFLRQNFGHKKG